MYNTDFSKAVSKVPDSLKKPILCLNACFLPKIPPLNYTKSLLCIIKYIFFGDKVLTLPTEIYKKISPAQSKTDNKLLL